MTRGLGSRRGWGAVLIALVLVAGLLMAQSIQIIWRSQGSTGARLEQSARPDSPSGRASLPPILEFTPFGSPAAEDIAAQDLTTSSLGLSNGTLVLQGVLLRDDPDLSRAMLSFDGAAAEGFAIGQTLPGGGTLTRIEALQVWVDLDGQEMTLVFPNQVDSQDHQDFMLPNASETAIPSDGSGEPATTPGLVVTMPAQP